MATRVTDGARWERQFFFFSGFRPRFAARARALSLLNLKKKINCSQSVYDEKTETHTSYLFLLKLELDNALQEFKRSINPQFVLDG